ncbi:glycoprotein precursor [Tapirape virus]|uniref:Envelopment polyprotein n=1 Tax=Tapirape virus TaxID=1538456 RepID=A0A088NBT8_9VIRU|nr:glycoprotein precursor [Tapirape virus]AIN55748.1 glycoprotein precursor [Tapirape virus]
MVVCHFILVLLMVYEISSRPEHYCFQGGRQVIRKNNVRMGHKQCIRDDISLVKVTYTKTTNDSHGPLYDLTVLRKDTVKNWFTCNPKATEHGPLQILEIDESMNMHFGHYSCTKQCDIKIEKEYGRVELSSNGLNYYEVLGTINQRSWMMSKIHIDLSNTCENLIITCGTETVQFHACFKQHMECNRFFKDSWVPSLIVNGFCSNIELFLFFLFLMTCFSLLWLIAKTFLCYFLIPIYLPIIMLYAKTYNAICKKCRNCGLACHPLQPCGIECVCGMIFESTERLKRHRESAIACKGYKTGIAARKACRSKISNFGLALFLACFFFFFITPTVAIQVPINDGRVLDAENISGSILALYSTVEKITTTYFYIQLACLFLSFSTIGVILAKYGAERHIKLNYRRCKSCGLYHKPETCRRQCICGFVKKDPKPEIHLESLMEIKHVPSRKCFLKLFKRLSSQIDMAAIIVLMLMFTTVSIGAAASECPGSETEDQYACKCLVNADKSVLNMSKDCLAFTNSISCSNAPKMLDVIKSLTHTEEAKKEIDKLAKKTKYELIELQKNANTSTWFYTYEILSSVVDCPTTNEKQAYLAEIEINVRVLDPYPCLPSQKSTHELECKCMKGESCNENNIKSSYEGKQEEFMKDLRNFMSLLHRLIPGGYQKIIFLAVSQKNEEILKFILDKIMSGYIQSTTTALGFAKVLKKSFSADLVKTTETPDFFKRMIDPKSSVNIHVPFDTVKGLVHTESIKICPQSQDWYIIKCLGTTDKDALHIIVCKGKGNVISLADLYEVSGNLCYLDQTCDMEMPPLKIESLGRANRFVCSKVTKEQAKGTYVNLRQMLLICSYEAQGSCKVKFAGGVTTRNAVKCSNSYIHADIKQMYQKADMEHGNYCFDTKCETRRPFIHPSRVTNCDFTKFVPHMQRDVLIQKHQTIEEYLDSIKNNLMQGLKVDKYIPTANLPKHVPIYKHLTLQGSETSDGITSSYITFSMAAMTGSSAGFHLRTPDGKDLFDIVVYILSSEVMATYDFAYTTGTTKTFTTYHDEICNDHCPKTIKGMPKEALSFYKERTSQWGCEEWGCLAINTGCIYGWCTDVISNDAKVYQKSVEGIVKINLCITMPTQTFCHLIEGVEPSIGETISAQLSTIDVEHFKTPILVRDGLVYHGQINARGSFAPICGSVQKVGSKTYGVGTAQVDYTCHLAQRKDIIVRRCFTNHYKSCLGLERYDVILGKRTNNTVRLKRNNLNLGDLSIKVMLGDISFKQFSESAEVQFKAKCVGCVECIDGISCNIEIHSDRDYTCPIKSDDCDLFYHNIMISEEKSEYNIKMKCDKKLDSVDLSICSTKQRVPLEVVQHKDKIEIDNNDGPTYIREEDLKCGNWLCKVYNEGIGGFTGIFKMFMGVYYYWAIGAFIIIILVILGIYLIMPLVRKFLVNMKEIRALDDRRELIIKRRYEENKKNG